jgi:hypothetical protein
MISRLANKILIRITNFRLYATITRLISFITFKDLQQKYLGHRFGPLFIFYLNCHYFLARLNYSLHEGKWIAPKLNNLKKKGFTILNGIDLNPLSSEFQKVQNKMPSKEGSSKIPIEIIRSDLKNGIVFGLSQIQNELESIYGTYFRINLLSSSRNRPSQIKMKQSFYYHFDDVTPYSLKVFFYLNDQDRQNGCFRFFSKEKTEEILKHNFDSSDPNRREKSQSIITPEVEKDLVFAEYKAGTVFIWHNRLIHKATLPKVGHRDLLQVEIKPSFFKVPLVKQVDKARRGHSSLELLLKSL